MPPTIRPFEHTRFGACVTDIVLNHLDDETWHSVEQAFHEYAFLVFPKLHPSEAAQASFAERFGDIVRFRKDQKAVPISNVRPDGTLLTPDDFLYKEQRGNEVWHGTASTCRWLRKRARFAPLRCRRAAGRPSSQICVQPMMRWTTILRVASSPPQSTRY